MESTTSESETDSLQAQLWRVLLPLARLLSRTRQQHRSVRYAVMVGSLLH